MIPSTLARIPVPDALKVPRSKILPPPSFTVGTVFLGSLPLSFPPSVSSVSMDKEL